MNEECQINVKLAGDHEEIKPGTAYLAPCDVHMRVVEKGKIQITDEPAYDGHKPSGNLLLKSVAEVYRENSIAVILTGMGKDGVEGVKAVKEMRGHTIAQNKETCIVFGMPMAAIEMNVVDIILPLDNISDAIISMLKK